MQNRILKDWFWPWQIFFDDRLKTNVENFALKLNSKEQELYKFLIDFYMSNYTFQMLIDYIKTNPQNQQWAIEYAKQNINKILNIPADLKDIYTQRVNQLNTKFKNDLQQILEFAIKCNNQPNYQKYYKTVLGEDNFLTVLKIINNHKNQAITYPKESVFDVKLLHKTFEDYIQNNNVFSVWQGQIPSYKTIVKQGDGYGEFWDKDLFDDYPENTLVLYQNNQTTSLDILYTLFHEVYPGHGNFFCQIKQNKNYLDMGSTMLIEGFATCCELSVNLNKNYQDFYFNKYVNFLKNIFNNKINKLSKTEKQYIAEYPMFKENYYVGALILLKKLNNLNDFYKLIKNNNLTDLILRKI